jgi:dihydroneopterin aldolase
MDNVIIHNLEIQARVGVTAAERAHPQRLLISVDMALDLTQAGQSDALAATVDYAAVADLVRDTVAQRERLLVEAVAHDVAAAVLALDLVQGVTIEVRKFSVPGSEHVAVRMTRQKP